MDDKINEASAVRSKISVFCQKVTEYDHYVFWEDPFSILYLSLKRLGR